MTVRFGDENFFSITHSLFGGWLEGQGDRGKLRHHNLIYYQHVSILYLRVPFGFTTATEPFLVTQVRDPATELDRTFD